MSHVAVITSEPGAYGDTGAVNVFRSTRRFWIAECSCGWHAGSGLGLTWFDTKRQAKAVWADHVAETDVGGQLGVCPNCGGQGPFGSTCLRCGVEYAYDD